MGVLEGVQEGLSEGVLLVQVQEARLARRTQGRPLPVRVQRGRLQPRLVPKQYKSRLDNF